MQFGPDGRPAQHERVRADEGVRADLDRRHRDGLVDDRRVAAVVAVVGVEHARALADRHVVAERDPLGRVQADLRAELHRVAEHDLAAAGLEQAVVADARVVAEAHGAAAQLHAHAGAKASRGRRARRCSRLLPRPRG